jgi:hypothetical protein
MDRRFFLKLCVSILAAPTDVSSIAKVPVQILRPDQIAMFHNLIDGAIYCCGAKKVADANLLERDEIENANKMKSGFQSVLGGLRYSRENPEYSQLAADVFQALKDRKKGVSTKYDSLFATLSEERSQAFELGLSKDELNWFEDALAEDVAKGNLQTKLKSASYRVVAASEKHWRKEDGKETYFTENLASARKLIWPGERNRLDTMMSMARADFLYPDSKGTGERTR